MMANGQQTTPQPALPQVKFNGRLMAEDIAAAGWSIDECARQAKVNYRTVYRFLRGEVQTARVNKRLATALKRSPARYVIREVEAAAS
jgi:transcriptional regulator with XRE-family HTH domain